MVSGDVTFLLFSGRSDGALMGSYMEGPSQKNVKLPVSENLIEMFIRKLKKTMVIMGYRFHDLSLLRYLTIGIRRRLTSALDRVCFCCESCGDMVHIHHTDNKGWTHSYCKDCYNELVLKANVGDDQHYHPGYNIGNCEISRHEITYHGSGTQYDEDFG